jgi:hypothetical protein
MALPNSFFAAAAEQLANPQRRGRMIVHFRSGAQRIIETPITLETWHEQLIIRYRDNGLAAAFDAADVEHISYGEILLR